MCFAIDSDRCGRPELYPTFGAEGSMSHARGGIHSVRNGPAHPTQPDGPKGGGRHGVVLVRSLVQGGKGEKSNGDEPDAASQRGIHFSFDDARALSGSLQVGPFEVTGYSRTVEEIHPVDLSQAAAALETASRGVNLNEIVPAEGLNAGGVSIIPGGSSGSVTACVQDEAGEWIRFESARVSSAPLDEISDHALNTDSLLALASIHDKGLARMIKVFLIGDLSDSAVPALDDMPVKISRGFTARDISMLKRSGVIKARRSTFALPGFKVPKKNPRKSRFITDCREFNARYDEFKDEKMNIPKLHDVMEVGCRFKFSASIDASAYFFQFKLGGEVHDSWFPMRFRHGGKIAHTVLTRLPMGFHLAPIIAQRTSNIVTSRTRFHMNKAQLQGTVLAWVDNFIVFANSETDCERIMELLKNQLRVINIKCSEVDTSQSFLGLTRVEGGLRLDETFVSRLRAAIREALQSKDCSKKQLEILGGMIMWLNYSTARIPLAARPATLAMLRFVASMPSSGRMLLSIQLRKELVSWFNKADGVFSPTSDCKLTTVWSDARPFRICIVINTLVFIGRCNTPVDISVGEALAAAWGMIMSNNAARSNIDNMGVGYAFAKGHCKSPSVNTIIANTISGPVPGCIVWVPSEDEVADAPTRDGLTACLVKRRWKTWKHIQSMFFISPY